MTDYLQVKNWDLFQHYKRRNPPWIRLYCNLDFDEDFMALTDAQKWHLVACWHDASKDKTKTGLISANEKSFKRRWDINSKTSVFDPLIKRGFLSYKQDASGMLATCVQDARPETEQSRDRAETEQIGSTPETAPETEPAIMTFPTKGQPDTWDLPKELFAEFETVYGDVMDVKFEMEKALLNVKSRGTKTARGMRKYLTDWVARTNNRQPGRGNGQDPKPKKDDGPPPQFNMDLDLELQPGFEEFKAKRAKEAADNASAND